METVAYLIRDTNGNTLARGEFDGRYAEPMETHLSDAGTVIVTVELETEGR